MLVLTAQIFIVVDVWLDESILDIVLVELVLTDIVVVFVVIVVILIKGIVDVDIVIYIRLVILARIGISNCFVCVPLFIT